MLALPATSAAADHYLPTTTLGDVVAHCPVCLSPGFAADTFCLGCGVEFEVGSMACAGCGTVVSAAARLCPSCGAGLD